MAYMTRLVVVVSVFLLSGCSVVAQNLSPAPVPAAAQPAVTSAESPAIHDFQKIEDAWDDAITGEDKTLHLEQRVITVRMLGDIAVANGTYELRRKAGLAPVEEKGVFTHVFERARGGWLCINSQRTKLPADSSSKAKKQTGAEAPFHIPIPLFGKSEKDK
jgi:ketosteroid isomerase-like protein